MGTMLYNGVELPDIESVWTDKETYPYAHIGFLESYNKYYLTICANPFVVIDDSDYSLQYVGKTKCYSLILPDETSWTNYYNQTASGSSYMANTLANVWSSHDLVRTDGSIYLAASDPVDPNAPVEPAPIFDADFLKGFHLGKAFYANLLRAAKGEPTGYFYGHVAKEGETATHNINGVDYVGAVLPKLPEWDKTAYPYATIFESSAYGYCIACSANTKDAYTNNVGEVSVSSVAQADKQYRLINGVWTECSLVFAVGSAVWANYDVRHRDDNSVYLAASDCVCIPIYGEPVAYLYNGVRLPKLPERDKEKYPYAVIENSYGSPFVWFFSEPPYMIDYLVLLPGPSVYAQYHNNMWSPSYERETDVSKSRVDFRWTNADILNEDGSVYLAASDPIPVYE